MNEILRKIPPVDQILRLPPVEALLRDYPRRLVLGEVQLQLQEIRRRVAAGILSEPAFDEALADLPESVGRRLAQACEPSLRRVINATGVLLHTNLGRAPLPAAAFEAATEVGASYSNLEYDVAAGTRGHRDVHFEARVRSLLACEAATVVNNNAASLFLILNSLAKGKKVLVSRGELIEIGGSFRIPEIMESSGAVLLEVGTTNKTRLSDYERAIDDDVGLILRVHPSNYRVVGFTERPELGELVRLARERNIPLVKDAGSGYLFRTSLQVLRQEPVVEEALDAGVDLVCFSGDKLLGGPQAGIIVGRKALIDKVRRNPLMRVCRVDKITYASLDWILLQYLKGRHLETLPVYAMLSATSEELVARCEALSDRLSGAGFQSRVVPGLSVVGGGAAPGETMPTSLALVESTRFSANEIERFLRRFKPSIVGRIEEDRVVLDLRTVMPADDSVLADAFSALASQ